MKKYLFLVVLLLLLTGCDTDVNVTINKNNVTENFNISMNNSNLNGDTVYSIINSNLLNVEHDSEVLSYFTIENSIDSNPLKVTRTYQTNNYNWDTAIARCFDEQNISLENDILKVSTSGGFNCFSKYNILDSVTINVKTDYKVLNNNATTINGNTYIWEFNRNSNLISNINLEVDLDNINKVDTNLKSVGVTIIIILLCIFMGCIVFIYIKTKSNKNNSI